MSFCIVSILCTSLLGEGHSSHRPQWWAFWVIEFIHWMLYRGSIYQRLKQAVDRRQAHVPCVWFLCLWYLAGITPPHSLTSLDVREVHVEIQIFRPLCKASCSYPQTATLLVNMSWSCRLERVNMSWVFRRRVLISLCVGRHQTIFFKMAPRSAALVCWCASFYFVC